MESRNIRKALRAALLAKEDLQNAEQCAREATPKGRDHKRQQRLLKAQAKRRHSKANRRLGKLQCDFD